MLIYSKRNLYKFWTFGCISVFHQNLFRKILQYGNNFGCNFANWLSEMKIMNEIVEIASKVGWHRTAPCRYRGKAELTAAPLYLSLLSPWDPRPDRPGVLCSTLRHTNYLTDPAHLSFPRIFSLQKPKKGLEGQIKSPSELNKMKPALTDWMTEWRVKDPLV